MTNPTTPRDPGERRLARPPSERYREPAPAAAAPAGPAGTAGNASPARGIGFAVLAGIGGAAVTAVAAVAFAVTAGLVVVAAATGWAVATALRVGAGSALTVDRRRAGAVVGGVAAVVLAQIVIWLVARSEGGVLSLSEYLAETYGVLVLAEITAAGVAAWWTAR